MAENILEKAKSAISDKLEEMKENIFGEEEKEVSEEFKDAGSSKAQTILQNIENSTAQIKRAGYEIKGMGVSLGFPPAVTLSFHYMKEVTDEERAQLLEDVKENKMLKIVIACLFKAGDFYKKVKFGDYALDGVNISLGLSMGVSMTFKKG